MKTKLIAFASTLFLGLAAANGAVTFTMLNYTGTTFGPNGLPTVDAAGAAFGTLAGANAFGSMGYFSALPTEGSVVSAATLLSTYVPVDNTSVAFTANAGLVNSQDYSSATNVYPAGFVGKQGYIVIGNNVNILSSTAISVYTLGTFFPAPAADNTASYTISLTSSTASVMYGNIRSVTVQPRIDTVPTNDYVNGVQMLSSGTFGAVPEPSAALLGAIGALGLLRRRRN